MNNFHSPYIFYKCVFLFFLVIVFNNISGQDQDFGLWTDFELQKKLSKRFDLEAEMGNRLKNNLSQRDESFAGISLSYSKKKFGLSAGYRFTNEFSQKRTYDLAHRFAIQVNYKPEIKRFTINYRVRLQAQYSGINSTSDGHLPDSFFRNRLKISYNVKGIPLEPSISYELFTRINKYATFGNQRKRIVLALRYKIFKNNEVEISFIRHETFNVDDPIKQSVVGIGYKLSI